MKLQTAEQMKKNSKENAKEKLYNKINKAASDGKLEIKVDEKEWFSFLDEYELELESNGYQIDYLDNSDGDTTVYISWR